MKTLSLFATLMVGLFLITSVTPKRIEGQTPDRVSRLEARVAELERRLAEVESKMAKDAGATTGAAVAKPGSNTKLLQDNAEKAIKALASSYGFDLRGGGNGCSFRVQSIAAIQLSQFSDNEATADVLLKCTSGGLVMKFIFQKDIDNHWFLTSIAGTRPGYQVDADAIAPYRNLKLPAQ